MIDKTPNNRATPRTEATFNALIDALIGYDKKQLYFSDLANACYAAKCDFQDVERELNAAKANTERKQSLVEIRERQLADAKARADNAFIAVDSWVAACQELRVCIAELEEEIEVLRSYGNNDCTNMADEQLERRRLARQKGTT